MSADRALRLRAFAKINLSLHIVGTRPDGYHELRTVFQSLALHDTLTFVPRRGPFAIQCDEPGCPAGPANLVWRAAQLAWQAAGRSGDPHGVQVRLQKRIPVQGGLGGGSSDAAAALRACGLLWRVKDDTVRALGGQIGADVPYFFEGGTALGLDRGDLLFPLIDAPAAWAVLAFPPFGVSTRDAFHWFDAALPAAGRPARSSPARWANDLQSQVAIRHPQVSMLVNALRIAGARPAAMTGSGSTVFGLFTSEAAAKAAGRRLSRSGTRSLVTRTLTRAVFARRSRPELLDRA